MFFDVARWIRGSSVTCGSAHHAVLFDEGAMSDYAPWGKSLPLSEIRPPRVIIKVIGAGNASHEKLDCT